MKILMITGFFAGEAGNPWLMDDLAAELARAGHEVHVIAHDAKTGHPRGEAPSGTPGVRLWHVGATRTGNGLVGRVFGHLQAAWGLRTTARRIVRDASSDTGPYDLAVYTSIALFSWGLPGWARRTGSVRRLALVLWDFFPIHQVEIGRIGTFPPPRMLKAIERRAIEPADVVAVISPANERFFRDYHRGIRAGTVVVPPWSSSGATVEPAAERRERFTVVFGGQLARGRGLGTLLDAAELLDGEPIDILIAGGGPEERSLRARAAEAGLRNVEFTGPLERADYRRLLPTVHAGLAITVPGVTPPTFPSKIVEYCGVGLPVIVAVEPSSDAGAFVQERGAGLAIPAGDAEALAGAMRALLTEHESGALPARSAAARALYDNELSAARAAAAIAGLAGTTRPTDAG